MIREAIQYVFGLGTERKELTDKNGDLWVHGQMTRIKPHVITIQAPIVVRSLESVVGYLKEAPDVDYAEASPAIVQVIDARRVVVISALGEQGERDMFLSAEWDAPEFDFSTFMAPEQFIIQVGSRFKRTDELAKLLSLVAAIKVGEGAEVKDNGVSQEVIVRRGVDVGPESIPNPIMLAPLRCFPEIQPVESPFTLRIRQTSSTSFGIALFQADGGMWEIEARKRIAAYLRERLEPSFVVENQLTILE